MIVADTSGLLAYFNAAEATHAAAAEIVDGERDPVVVSPFVVAELDYLVATRIGVDQELAILHELSAGAYELPSIDAAALREVELVITRYRDQQVGVTDASLVVLAQRYGTRTILTLDRRHFDVLRPLSGGRFKILP